MESRRRTGHTVYIINRKFVGKKTLDEIVERLILQDILREKDSPKKAEKTSLYRPPEV